MDTFGFKDFESVRLKATYNMEIGSREITKGETIVFFDTVQIAGLQEMRQYVTAHGGYGDRNLIYWDTTREIKLNFSQGVFSKEQLAVLFNSRLGVVGANQVTDVPMREYIESDGHGVITCKYTPVHNTYVYNRITGAKLEFTQDGKNLTIENPYTDVIVDYEFDYEGSTKFLQIGRRWFNGFLELDGKTRFKDDVTGDVVTGLIRIPRLKLMSDLSIRLGAQANPIVGNFSAVGVPVGSRDNSYVSEFFFLDDYLESDL